MTPPNIPLWYRLWHLYFEPLAALNGSYLLAFKPVEYYTWMPHTAQHNPSSQIVADCLGTTYILFAFIEGVFLRVVDDVRLWKWILFGLAICDTGHIVAEWRAMGNEVAFNPSLWSTKDTITMFLNFMPLCTRIAFVLGVGLGEGKGKKA